MCEMPSVKTTSSTERISSLVPKLVAAGLGGDHQRLELLCLNAIRVLKEEYPEMTNELGNLLA